MDRSAAYYGRYVAKNIVAAGLAKKCEIIVAYAIGVANPVSIAVDTHGTGTVGDDKIIEIIKKHFDFRPQSIIEELDLLRPIYLCHFGREDLDVPWEKTDKAHLF